MHTLAKSTSMGVSHPAPRVIPMVSTKGEKVNLLKAPTLPDSLPMQVKKLSS